MSRRMHWLVALAVAGFATSADAQQRPDFAGVWATVPAADAAAAKAPLAAGDARFPTGDMGSGWESPVTITQDARRLTVTYTFFVPYDLQAPLTFVYNLDGTESRNSVRMGRGLQVQRATAAWAGDTLVLSTRHEVPYPKQGAPQTVEVQQRLTIAPDRTLVVETTRVGVPGAPTTTTRTVFAKR